MNLGVEGDGGQNIFPDAILLIKQQIDAIMVAISIRGQSKKMLKNNPRVK